MERSSYARSIELPADHVFRNLKSAKRFAVDIGGSLTKLAYYSTVTQKMFSIVDNKNNSDEIYKVSEEDVTQEQLHFIKFETKYIESCLEFIRENLIGSKEYMNGKVIKVTGGGAFKYRDLLVNKLGIEIDKEDEMACLIKGCNFLLKNIPDESFLYHRHGNPEYRFLTTEQDALYPYLLVNIGSGVSILKVEGEDKYERIGGTSMGGGTFWGLGSILTKAKGFDELLDLANEGDHRNVDILVKDIYGGAYSHMGLPADLIASSFCKAARSHADTQEGEFHDADIAKSLLIALSNDIGQISCLHAKVHNLKKIYFGGYFIRGHPTTMHKITYAINYWSKGKIQAMFLRHEGYLGAVGAFLKGVEEEDADRYSWGEHMSWGENYAGSFSGIHSPLPAQLTDHKATFDMLELDRFAKPLVNCPLLLDPASYAPDTVDLTEDHQAREYWLQCFTEAIDKFADRAIQSQPSKSDAEKRAKRFKEKYIARLNELKKNPCAYGSLTVRSLLDTREHCMAEFHFVDPYSQQKQMENEQALRLLSDRLMCLDKMEDAERLHSLALGMLAGNVFDWGAKEVAMLMEGGNFGFEEAMAKLQPHPWLFDDYESWKERLKGPSYNCAVIFVDNSGIDVIMGIFPFTRELLNRGTSVILCANSRPALNDVTYNELTALTKRVAMISEDISKALLQDRLFIMESGQGSPCLDLRYIDYDLSEKMKDLKADLLVLEGMGRAVHTNFHAAFNCDTLKVAVLKNRWLANHLGGDMFSIMFKFETAKRVVCINSKSKNTQNDGEQ